MADDTRDFELVPVEGTPFDPDESAKRMFSAPASGFAERVQKLGGDRQGNVEDRRADPQSGYEHILADNQTIRGIVRLIVGAEPFADYPVKYARRPTGGQL
jgi:hypothetical protein